MNLKLKKIIEHYSSINTNKEYGFIRFLNLSEKKFVLELNEKDSITVFFTSKTLIRFKNEIKNFNYVKIKHNIIHNFNYDKKYYQLLDIKILHCRKSLFWKEKERMEIRLSSNYSQMDSIIKKKELFEFLKISNINTFGLVDKNDHNGYVSMLSDVIKHDKKMFFGVEVLAFDDDKKLQLTEDDVYVVVDIETNGTNPLIDELLEIGAYMIKNYQILNKFNCLVKIKHKIKDFINKITNINEEMLLNADKEEIVIKKFFNFITMEGKYKTVNIVCHSDFDWNFLNYKFKKLNYQVNLKLIDTLMLTRQLYDLPKYNLKFLSVYFELKLLSHHRALSDALATTKLFFILLNKIFSENNNGEIIFNTHKNYLYKILLYAKNLNGMYDILNMLTIANTTDKLKIPRLRWSLIEKNRKNILIVDYFSEGLIIYSFFKGKNESVLKCYSERFDGVEITDFVSCLNIIKTQILGRRNFDNKEYFNFLFKDNENDDLKYQIKTYLEWLKNNLTDKVICSSNAKYIFWHDYKTLQVVKNFQKNPDTFFNLYQFIHTSDDFNNLLFIGEETLKNWIFNNSKKIFNKVEHNINIFKSEVKKQKFKFNTDEMRDYFIQKAKKKYGNILHKIIINRIEHELKILFDNNFMLYYWLAYDVLKFIKKNKEILGSRGSIGSSFIGYLLDLTHVNPLPPHNYCKMCNKIFFKIDEENGYDLDVVKCNQCRKNMLNDGHNLDISMFLGIDGNKIPDIDLNVSTNFQRQLHNYVFEHLKKEKYSVYRSGTVLKIREKNAVVFLKKFITERSNDSALNFKFQDCFAIFYKILDVVTSYGRHPGGLVISLSNDINKFTFLTKNNGNDELYVTRLKYKFLKLYFFKLDILGHDDPKTLNFLLKNTKICLEDIKFNDKKVIDLFTMAKTNGIPEFCTDFSKKVLRSIKPTKFSELVNISGLTHGINVWFNNNDKLIKYHNIKELICCRDDITYILSKNYNIDFKVAYNIMEFVRHGKIKTNYSEWIKIENLLKRYSIPEWMIKSLSKITYIFPKAHACAYVISAFRLAYFKVYYPKLFFLSVLNKHVLYFKYEFLFINNISDIKKIRYSLFTTEKNKKNVNRLTINLLNIIKDIIITKKFKFSKPSLNKSDSTTFILENNTFIAPFCIIKGLGNKISDKILYERHLKVFKNIYDFKYRCGLGDITLKLILNQVISDEEFKENFNTKTFFINLDDLINKIY